MAEPVVRNLRITQCYHALSAAVAERISPGANWCTFATWASRQAGQTIRGEDFAVSSSRWPGRVSPLAKRKERYYPIFR